jgi:23S rRNA (cytidine2498-2'-O)-methyltransferase
MTIAPLWKDIHREEPVNTEDLLLVTAHAEFSQAAIAELQQIDPQLTYIEALSLEVTLCSNPGGSIFLRKVGHAQPIFVRHLAPVQQIIEITNEERDIGAMALAVAALSAFTQLERGVYFAVQTRFVQADNTKVKRAYTSGQVNRALAEAFAEETGAIESIKKPLVIVSILCTTHQAYLGISTATENLSSWPGGARHYAQTKEQISRAEFKLLEALEEFDVALPACGHALDLGAAPGGWTRLLLEAGLTVTAVDPALLDKRLVRHPHLIHYRGYAEDYLEAAINKHQSFDVIVNDMRMDARDAARLLVTASPCLRQHGFIISTLKLPHEARTIHPLSTLREALSILEEGYDYVRARQLFHNRQEVTILAVRPRSTRRR